MRDLLFGFSLVAVLTASAWLYARNYALQASPCSHYVRARCAPIFSALHVALPTQLALCGSQGDLLKIPNAPLGISTFKAVIEGHI